MAEEVDPMTNPALDWVGLEPRGIASVITPTSLGTFSVVEEDLSAENYAVYAPRPHHRVCSTLRGLGCFMYEIIFKHQGLRLPFSALAVRVFKHLDLAPSQLHPNSMAFLVAFERLCEYHSVAASVELFFRVFKLQRQTNSEGQRSWESLKQRVPLFDIYVDSVRGYKSRYYLVRPETQTGIDSMYTAEPEMGADGAVERGEDGREKTKLVPRFPMSWSRGHFEHQTEYYLTADEDLSDEDREGLAKLQRYVQDLIPARWETKDGVPVLDKHGREQFSPRLISTKRLLECRNRAEAKIFFGIGHRARFIIYFLLA
jgi:hypothetical protein